MPARPPKVPFWGRERYVLMFFCKKNCACGQGLSPLYLLHTSLVSLLSPQKLKYLFKSEVFFVLPSLVAPLSWCDDGIVGQTNILFDPPFHVDHGDAIF
jgi:hypothetical protein